MYFRGMSCVPSSYVAMPDERDLLDRGKALMLYFYNIATKPLLRHRVEQTGVSVILRRYGAAGREWLERLFFERRISMLAL